MSTRISKKKVFLHIGFFKTGTSAVQEFLYINRGLLVKNNYFYPDLGCRESQSFTCNDGIRGGFPVFPVS